MKNHARAVALALSLGVNAVAAPFIAVGDNAELFLTAAAGVKVDDNIYLLTSGKEQDDVIFNFTPGVEFVFGKNSATSGNVYYRHEFLRYSDLSQQDTSLANVGANALYNNGKSKVDLGASYAETAMNEISTPGFIVPMDMTNVRALAEFGATEKTTLGAGVRYEKKDYKIGGGFRDSDIVTIPMDVYFEYSPKLQASVGYRFRDSNLGGSAIDSQDHFFNVGARGEFTPKLSGQVRVGFVQRDFDNNSDDSDFGAEISLNYAASPKTTFAFGASNDYGSSAVGDSTSTLAFNVGADTRLDEQWSWNVNLALRSIDYPTRSDDFFQGDLGFVYTHNVNLKFMGGVTIRSQSSTSALSEFDNSVFSLAANLRY